MFNCGPTGLRFESALPEHFAFPPVVQDWVNKGLGISGSVCAPGHTKDPMPLIEKSRT